MAALRPTPRGLGLAGLGVLGAVLLSGGSAGVVVHFLAGELSHSTSAGAVLWLFAYLSLTLVLPPARTGYPMSSRWAWLTVLCVATGLLANLAVTLDWHARYAIPFGTHVYQWQDGQVTYNALLHSHLGKPASLALLRLLGSPSGRMPVDLGGPLAAELTGGMAAVLVLTALAGFVFSLLALRRWRAVYTERPELQFIWALAAVNGLKSIFDGGALHHAALFGLITLAAMAFSRPAGRAAERRLALAPWLALSAYAGLALALTGTVPALGEMSFKAVLVLLLLSVRRQGLWVWAYRAALLAFAGLNLAVNAASEVLPQIRSSSGWLVFSRRAGEDFSARPMLTLGPSTALDVYRALGENPAKPRLSLLWPDGRRSAGSGRRVDLAVRPLSWDRAAGQIASNADLRVVALAGQGEGWLSLTVETRAGLPAWGASEGGALARNNAYAWLYRLDEQLRAGGLVRYILVPLTPGKRSEEATLPAD